jgi:hypothetical protein
METSAAAAPESVYRVNVFTEHTVLTSLLPILLSERLSWNARYMRVLAKILTAHLCQRGLSIFETPRPYAERPKTVFEDFDSDSILRPPDCCPMIPGV